MHVLARSLFSWCLCLSAMACNSGGGDNAADGGPSSSTNGGQPEPSSGDQTPVDPGMFDGTNTTYGSEYTGGEFHLGPVDYDETQWHNACAPATKYAAAVRDAQGTLLAGLWSGIPNVGGYCDACILVKTAMGKSATLRVVTYGDTTPNSIDVSPEAYKLLDSGEYPRTMTWQFTKCPDTGKIMYEFQTGSSEWWTSLWVRNARVPIKSVEVKSKNHANYVTLERAGDGTLTDASGFGLGEFSIRITGIDDAQVVDTFAWPSGGIAGQTLMGKGNFP